DDLPRQLHADQQDADQRHIEDDQLQRFSHSRVSGWGHPEFETAGANLGNGRPARKSDPLASGRVTSSIRAMPTSRLIAAAAILGLTTIARAQKTVDWPVYGGSDDHTHYTTLSQVTPANVRQLTIAWTYETHDEF